MRTPYWITVRLLILLVSLSLLAAGCVQQTPLASPTGVAAAETASSESSTPSGEQPAAAELSEGQPAAKEQPAAKLPGAEQAAQSTSPVQWSDTPPCAEGDCGGLMITLGGQPQQVGLGGQSLAPAAKTGPLPAAMSADGRWVIDTGQPSPDGKWAAYTSISHEGGGPIFLQDLKSGQWTNLIEAVKARLGGGEALPQYYWWDVIGWFPDSQRLLIGPTDASIAAVVDLVSSTAEVIPFDGGGRGGRLFVNLAPDGQHFVFTAADDQGQQTFQQYDLNNGEVKTLFALPYEQGYISNPRYAPDGKTLAFVTQKGPAGSSAEDTLNLLELDSGAETRLVEGSLWMAVPAWSPDGQRIAFAMADGAAPALASGLSAGDAAAVRGNVWVVTTGGTAEQVTFIDGLARSPVWSKDSQTLAFVTHDGQVGLANADQPGLIWRAAGPSGQPPELTSAFFLP